MRATVEELKEFTIDCAAVEKSKDKRSKFLCNQSKEFTIDCVAVVKTEDKKSKILCNQ